MSKDEIVTALRCCASPEVDCKGNCAFFGASSPNEDCSQKKNTAAADLIENQQRNIEALMKANAGLRDTVLRRDAEIEKLAADRKALFNELCQYCGEYERAHEGACDGCRWRDM